MIQYKPGEVVLVLFPQTGGGKGASRPALVLLDSGDLDLVLARITSQVDSTAYDVALTDWRGAGLLTASVIRLHKLATIEKKLIQRQLGLLQNSDTVSSILQKTFGNW